MTLPYDIALTRLDGSAATLADWSGDVLLIVNTASECGFTPQYEGLQSLYDEYRARGFTVLGFPSNQFGSQEPGSAEEIGAFCRRNYGVTFPMFAKIDVKGANAHPLFRWLTEHRPGALGSKAIKWNFTKFLVDRHGKVASRYSPSTSPESLRDDIEQLLG